MGLEEQATVVIGIDTLDQAAGVERNTLSDFGNADFTHQFIEKTADLTYIACYLGHTFLPCIHLFKYDHGQVDVVFLEAEQRGGVVHQHVGIKDEESFGRWVGLDH